MLRALLPAIETVPYFILILKINYFIGDFFQAIQVIYNATWSYRKVLAVLIYPCASYNGRIFIFWA